MKILRLKRMMSIAISFIAIFCVWAALQGNISPSYGASLPAPKISCTAVTYNSVTVHWTAVTGAKSYIIYKYSAPDGMFKRIAVVSGSGSGNYKVTGLTRNTTYKFMVRAAKTSTGTYVGAKSSTLTVTTLTPRTYRITPESLPTNPKMLNYGYYNSKTRQYYTVRSYMELFEASGGGTLILSPGTYTITNTIFVPSNVKIILEDGVLIKKGMDTGSTLSPSRSLFQLIRPSKGHTSGAVGKYDGERNISILGYGSARIDMQYMKDANCIQTGHNQNLTIKDIDFYNAYDGHFVEMDATLNALVEDCGFYNIKGSDVREAINLDTPDKVTGGFTAIWSKFDGTANSNVRINRCMFTSMGRGIGTHNYSGDHTHNYISITDCTMTEIRSYAIGMMNWKYAVISGNRLIGSTTSIANGRSGILGLGIKSCSIKYNVIGAYKWPVLCKSWQGTSAAEIKAYAPIHNYFSIENINDLKTNQCLISMIDLRALIVNPDGSMIKISLPLLVE